MEFSFSNWIDEDCVLEFSDDESNDTMDQADNYGDQERIRRDSKRCDSSQLMNDYAQLKLENYCEGLRLNQTQEKKRKFVSEHSALPKHSPEKLQKISTDMEKDEMVNVPKLIYQLLNAKVVIEKMCESSGRDLMSETKCVLPNGAQLKDSIQRYCPKCKTLKADKHGVTLMKSCPKCETAMTYLCSNCNSKQYPNYENLRRHWNKCEQAADTCKKLNPSDFLVEKTEIDYTTEIIRYCSRCNKTEENCSKWKEDVCRNCDHYLLYQCNKCKAQYSRSYRLAYHMQSKCYLSQYKCNQCHFTNPSWDRMRRHVDSVHFGTKIHCPRCNNAMKNEASLRHHLRYCGLEPKFNCNCCAFKTKYRRSLKSHMKTAHGN